MNKTNHKTGFTILVTDDDEDIRFLLGKALTKEGHALIFASSGEDAIEQCKKNNIDLALLDFEMSGKSGLDTGISIYSMFNIPFIIISQFGDAKVITKTLQAGALGYIVKPIDLEKIGPTVNKAIERTNQKNVQSSINRAEILAQELNENRRLLQNQIAEDTSNRKALVQNLHDEVGSLFVALKANAFYIRENSEDDICEKSKDILKLVVQLEGSIRNIMVQLRPDALESLGLAGALEYLTSSWDNRHSDCNVILNTSGDFSKVHNSVDLVVYRIIQECLSNTAKHSQASNVSISLSMDIVEERIYLTIVDNGKGFDPITTQYGLGLIGIREKIYSLNGAIDVKSSVDAGVNICIEIPCQ